MQRGDEFPDFEMEDENGEKVRKEDLLGLRYILFFYAKDGTPGCTTEANEFGAEFPNLALRNIYAFGVSADSPESHARFRSANGFKEKLLTDADHGLAKKVGAFGEKRMYGKTVQGTIRSTFLIGKDGRIEEMWVGVKSAGHAKKVAEAALRRFRSDVPADY